jgi:hypothetical protein
MEAFSDAGSIPAASTILYLFPLNCIDGALFGLSFKAFSSFSIASSLMLAFICASPTASWVFADTICAYTVY